jgi:hypothetical protein
MSGWPRSVVVAKLVLKMKETIVPQGRCCIDVLKNGYQRQRILAAHYLCLLDPGTPLFNTSAPAWRQQRLLARM